MQVLGLHIGIAYRQSAESYLHHSYRDSVAALVASDGSAVTATEAQLSGIPATPAFPVNAIRSCLAARGIDWSSITSIVLDLSEAELDHNVLQQRLQDPRRAASTGREWLAALFVSEFGIDVAERLHFCEHPLAHVHHALRGALPTNALCLCLDGGGNLSSGMVAQANGSQLEVLSRFTAGQSLMKLYRVINGLLGFDATDVFATMALAPRGDPASFWPQFEHMHQLLAGGSYSLASESEMLEILDRAGLTRMARRGAVDFSQAQLDIVAAAQLVLRRIVGHVLKHYQGQTKADTLYLCGSVALNTEINGRVMYAGLFDKVIVPEAPDDVGNALGAAFSQIAARQLVGYAACPPASVFAGTGFQPTELASRIAAWKPLVEADTLEHVIASTASLLAQGAVIGWMQDEAGLASHGSAAALLLADPRVASSASRIAQILGGRQELLHRIAVVPGECLSDFVDLPGRMTALPVAAFNLRLQAAARSSLMAATWVDGTALVQGIDVSAWPMLHELTHAFGKLADMPALLSADFIPTRGPATGTLDEMIGSLIMGGLDGLIVQGWLIRARPGMSARDIILQLVPAMAGGQRLALQCVQAGDVYTLEAIAALEFAEPVMAISAHAYQVLGLAEPLMLRERCQQLGMRETEIEALADELLGLWRAGRISACTEAACRHGLSAAKSVG